MGSLNPGFFDSLGCHLSHGLQAPITCCREVVLVAAQVQGLQPGTHRTKRGEAREGTVRQGCGWPAEQRSHSQGVAQDPVTLFRSSSRKDEGKRKVTVPRDECASHEHTTGPEGQDTQASGQLSQLKGKMQGVTVMR